MSGEFLESALAIGDLVEAYNGYAACAPPPDTEKFINACRAKVDACFAQSLRPIFMMDDASDKEQFSRIVDALSIKPWGTISYTGKLEMNKVYVALELDKLILMDLKSASPSRPVRDDTEESALNAQLREEIKALKAEVATLEKR